MGQFVQNSLILLGMISTIMTAEAKHLPFVKGNHWVYSYHRDETGYIAGQLDSTFDQGSHVSAIRDGILSFTLDSIVTISGLNDTVYLTFGIIDSSTINESYSKSFRFYNDSFYPLDADHSGEFTLYLLSFQSYYDRLILAPINSDSSAMVLLGKNEHVFSRIENTGWCGVPYSRISERFKLSDTVQFIPDLGTVYYSVKESYYSTNFTFAGGRSNYACYTLVSFNGTAIPAIAKPVILQVVNKARIINHKKAAVQNQILLTGKDVMKQIPNSICYSIRGQKVNAKNGSQMLLFNKANISR